MANLCKVEPLLSVIAAPLISGVALERTVVLSEAYVRTISVAVNCCEDCEVLASLILERLVKSDGQITSALLCDACDAVVNESELFLRNPSVLSVGKVGVGKIDAYGDCLHVAVLIKGVIRPSHLLDEHVLIFTDFVSRIDVEGCCILVREVER